jgi:PAS domain S-box-containing protein
LDLLALLANQAAAALENARWSRSLEQKVEQRTADLEQRNAELTIINSISQALAKQLDLQAIVDLIGDKIGEIFASDTTYIDLYDRQTNLIHCLYFVERGHRRELEPISLGKTLSSTVITTKQPLLLGTAQQAAAFTRFEVSSPDTEQDLNESYLGVPILIGDDLVGAVVVQSYRQNAYGEEHVRLLSTLAANIGVALENARLFEETNRLLQESRQRTVELATVNTISQALISERDLDSLIELVGEQMRHTFEADVVYVALHDPQTGLIHFPYEFENGKRLTGQPMPYGQGMTSNIIDSGQPLLINEDNLEKHAELGIEVVGTLAKSFLGVPITVGQKVIGVISVQSIQVEGRFDASDVALLSTIAANVGAAIHNAQLYRETQRRANEMAALAEIGREISATLDLDIVLERIAAYARRLLLGDDSAVFLCETEGQTLRAIVALGDIAPQLKALSIPMGQGIIGDLALRGEAEIINNVPYDPRTLHIPGTLEGAEERLLAAPLLSREQVIGMMAVWREWGGDMFTQADLDFLVGLARQATIAITNARLFAEVQRQKQYFEALVANSPVAIVTIDLEGKGETWNPAAEKLFGYTQEESFGQQIDDLVASADDIHSEARHFSQRIARGQPVRAITRRTCKNGTLVDVELFAEPVIVDGKQVGIIAIYHDITELLQARREAEAASKAKSVFLANMSHELRTPLNAILGFSRIVRRKGAKTLPQRQLENLDKVLVSAEHLLGLINAVLDIAKIEAGRMDVQPSTFDPAVLVEVCATTVQPMVKARVRLVRQIEQDLPQAYSDQDKLKQILLNLLSNAAKFTHEGQITLGAHRRGEMLVVDVIDTGIGIPQEALERIFEEFQQADASTTRRYGGTGLGLSISRKLARLLGGDLMATSVEGVGSTFTLTIPLHYSGPLADDAASRSSFLTTRPQPMPRKPVLLAIDDDPDVIYLLRESLDEAGYLVVGATSGDEGVQKAQELRPFAITLDVSMPHKDGWQVLHELKAHPATQDIPVIMLTMVDKKALGYRLGVADYLVKPLDEETVLDALQRLSPAKGPTPCNRLLVVDDDPQVVDMVRQFLDESLCEVEAVTDGRAALEAVARQRPDIILLDLMMPRPDGLGVIEQLRQDPDYRDIPVVVLSARTLNAEERTLLEQSVSQVIRKQGLEAEVLIQELQKALVS